MLEGKALKMTWTYNIYSIQALGQVPLTTYLRPWNFYWSVSRDVDFLISYAKVFFIDRIIKEQQFLWV